MVLFHRYGFLGLLIAIIALRPNLAHAHGTPIHVESVENQLVVTTGLTDPAGFAPRIIHEYDEDGEPFNTATLTGFGPAVMWQLPGYDIFGLQENSGLYLEPIARPVAGADPSEDRVLWYWNPATELVEPAEAGTRLQIRKQPTVHTTISADSETAPPPLKLAAPVAADMGFHNHLALYALDAVAPTGAYGFFARLTSDLYEPSKPLLLVFNHGIYDYELMTTAALAINAAAIDSLPGDYNLDGNVDAADYTVWRDGLGSEFQAEDYQVWKDHFGQSLGGNGSGSAGSVAVPEPTGPVLAACTAAFFLMRRKRPKV